MLVVNGLRKRYGAIQAVDDVSFTIPSGVSFGLLGPNGAGKTTTISMIAGTIDADGGSVSLDGTPVSGKADAAKKRIGYVPQELALYQDLTARRNLRFFGALYGMFGTELNAASDRVLDLVGLSEHADRPVKTYSGGMKRRLNIAIGLLHGPDLLIFDEPTVGVDPQTRNAIFDCLAQLGREGKTILYTTHYMEEVERICQEVAIMDHGKVVANGNLANLTNHQEARREISVELESPCDLEPVTAIPGVAEWFTDELTLKLVLDDLDKSLARALEWLSQHGQRVVSIESKKTSLEQVFLDLTGRSLRD